MTKRLSPNDAMFLFGETRETMMHVAALMPFSPAPDTPPDHLRRLMAEVRTGEVYPPWNLKLRYPDLLKNPLQSWVEDPAFDPEYHVRRTALPSPGDERELGIIVSRLHSNAIDFHRPPWEAHFIEGLEGGRFAFYVKVHHCLIDGYTAVKILARSLARDPNERHRPLFFHLPEPAREPRDRTRDGSDGGGVGFPDLLASVRTQLGATRSVGHALATLVRQARAGERDLITPLHAPRCVLNSRISRSRRFATQQVELARVKAVAQAGGGTVNDVVLALSSASLRRYLEERSALPSSPLVAMVPVNLRPKGDPGGGNAVGAILASLATDVDDPKRRLEAIITSTTKAKEQLQGMSASAIVQYSALLLTPFLLQTIPGAVGRVPPTFNVVISNVPGPDEALYFRGARLEATYPMSIPVHGLALNITVSGYAGTLNFGFIGCRDTLPHLQRMAVYCGEALGELQRAYGVAG
jgi:WS/DGAT/MGAT family acyltransferase